MTEQEMLIMEMINEGQTLNEIAKSLWLSPRQIHQKIQKLINDGYLFNPIYYDNGDITYNFENKTNLKHTINLTLTDSSRFKALVISDIHIGNELENLSYLYMMKKRFIDKF